MKLLLSRFLTAALLLTLSTNVEASHFRGGTLYWTYVSSTSAEFTLVAAFRYTAFPLPVGGTFAEFVGGTGLDFGDASSTGVLTFKVISIDPVNDWLLAVALDPADLVSTTITHVYPSSNNGGLPWIASVASCCRTGGEANNPNGNYSLYTDVDLSTGNSSPVSSIPAIINMVQSPAANFLLTANDVDPNTTLTYRLATPAEAGIGFFNQPSAGGNDISVDAGSGLVTWNTTLAPLGSLYSCQIIIEDRDANTLAIKTVAPVDFLIRIVNCPPANVAPAFVSPTPTCGTVYNVNAGGTVSFTVDASDADALDIVTLNSAGIPAGASLSPGLPASGNPVSSSFSWTPTLADVGAYVVTFSASDDCGAQVICSYTINVSACPVITVDAGPDQTVYYGYAPLACASLTAVPSAGTAPFTYAWSNGDVTASINVCPASTTTYTVDVTDANGCMGQGSVTVEVVDVRCGNKNDKVLVCHNGHNICISANAVPAHMANHPDDYLGPCAAKSSLGYAVTLNAYPNPSSGIINLEINHTDNSSLLIEVVNLNGQLVYSEQFNEKEGFYLHSIDLGSVANGLYMIRLSGDTVLEMQRIQIQK